MSPQTSATEIITGLIKYGDGLAATLIPFGLALTLALFTIKVAWEGLQIAVGSRSVNDGIANLLLTAAIGGTVAMLFAPGPAGLYSTFINIISGGFDAIAQALTGTGGYDTSQLTALTTPLFRVITKLWGAGNTMMAQETWNPFTALVIMGQAVVLLLFAALYMVVFGIAIVTFMMASVVFAIGVAFGPILIPWVMFKPLEAAMDRWFWFVVTAGFQKVMILVILLMGAKATETILGSVTAAIEQGAKDKTVMLSPDPFLVLFIVGVLLMLLVMRSDAITNALLPGHGAIGLTNMMKAAGKLTGGGAALSKGAANVGAATAKGAASLATGAKNAAQFGHTVANNAAQMAAGGMSAPRATLKAIVQTASNTATAYNAAHAAGSAVGKAKAWAANPFAAYRPANNPQPAASPQQSSGAARAKMAEVKSRTRGKR
ncbi:MAG: type IV secretion system protein [Rhodocyclaceae bacterium]|nr:type IV secretion system protein [Rhodocyclaceae bacterium]